MKVANIIMAHKNPSQLERMIKSMNHPNFYFYIHLDKKVNFKDFEYLMEIENVKFIENRMICNWGGFSFVNAIFASVGEILSEEKKYDFFNLMSAQDYPIRPMEEISNYFEQRLGKCFISYDEDYQQSWWTHAVTRFELYHFTDLTFKGRYFVQGLFNKFLPKRRFPLAMKLYGSSISSWWTISAECAAYMIDFLKNNTKLRRFMSYTWGADEFLIATIIMNSPFSGQVVNNNLRYITWTEGIANPLILMYKDLDSIRASGKFFARKFDTNVDMKILDELDHILSAKQLKPLI